jgi:hypothetical protein
MENHMLPLSAEQVAAQQARLKEIVAGLGLEVDGYMVSAPGTSVPPIDVSAIDPDRLVLGLMHLAYQMGIQKGRDDKTAEICSVLGVQRAA